MRDVVATGATAGVTAGAALVLAGGLTACGAPPGTVTSARRVAESYAGAVAAGDSAAVCALLTGATASELDRGGTPCPAAVDDLGLDDPGPLQDVEVWGRSALARFGGDDVFLTLVNGAWRVSAAGCELAPGRPADCEVGG